MSSQSASPIAGGTTDEDWSRKTVLPYIGVLGLVALLALAMMMRIDLHYRQIIHRPDLALDGTRLLLTAGFWGQFLLFWRLSLWRLPPALRGRRPLPRTLLTMGRLASGLSLATLMAESMSIYRLKIESYDLLFEALLLYVAVTLNFLFWYWFVDHPPRHPGQPWERTAPTRGVSMPYGIVFAEEILERDLLKTESWKPNFVDYLYFTILSSNCFGAPEGHALVGAPIKRLHMLHSLVMLSVFIVILARAINTLG